jgi:hypothetical protein
VNGILSHWSAVGKHHVQCLDRLKKPLRNFFACLLTRDEARRIAAISLIAAYTFNGIRVRPEFLTG